VAGIFPISETQRLSPPMNGMKQQRGPDRPRVCTPEEKDLTLSGGLVFSETSGLHKSHSLCLVIGDCLFNQFLLLTYDFPAWKLLMGKQNYKETLRSKFSCFGGSYLRAFCPIG
jgi:hypothetical protein